MPAESWILTDLDQDLFLADWRHEISPGVQVEKRVLQGGKRQGVDSVKVKSEHFSFEVLPTRGMNIWKIWTSEMEFGWQSPAKGPVHPCHVPLMEPGGLGWLDGFDEVFARCGLESNGAPEHDEETNQLLHPLHGKISNTPARKVTVSIDNDEVRITGVVEEARFHFLKMRMTSTISWKIGSTSLDIEDAIENISASDGEIQMLYHINFGVPLLDAGSQFVSPLRKLVPRNLHAATGLDAWEDYSAPTAGFEEQVYFLELAGDASGETKTVLKNSQDTSGVAVRHNVNQLPCFSLWKNTTAVEDGYVTGLEPATNFPNPRSFEGRQDRVVKIPAHQQTTFHVGLDFLTHADAVAQAEADVRRLAPDEVKICQRPQADWCHGISGDEES